jgi:DNA-binding NtrC family response regulator
LNVFPLTLPPLRERKDDISLLAQHFLERIEEKEKGGFRDFEPGAMALLDKHSWPGNVRELRNIVHRAFVLSNPPLVGVSAVDSVLGHSVVIKAPAKASEKSSAARKASKKKPRASPRAGARS